MTMPVSWHPSDAIQHPIRITVLGIFCEVFCRVEAGANFVRVGRETYTAERRRLASIVFRCDTFIQRLGRRRTEPTPNLHKFPIGDERGIEEQMPMGLFCFFLELDHPEIGFAVQMPAAIEITYQSKKQPVIHYVLPGLLRPGKETPIDGESHAIDTLERHQTGQEPPAQVNA